MKYALLLTSVALSLNVSMSSAAPVKAVDCPLPKNTTCKLTVTSSKNGIPYREYLCSNPKYVQDQVILDDKTMSITSHSYEVMDVLSKNAQQQPCAQSTYICGEKGNRYNTWYSSGIAQVCAMSY